MKLVVACILIGELQSQVNIGCRGRIDLRQILSIGFKALPPAVIKSDQCRRISGRNLHQSISKFSRPPITACITAREHLEHRSCAQFIRCLEDLAVDVASKDLLSAEQPDQLCWVGGGHRYLGERPSSLPHGAVVNDEEGVGELGWIRKSGH